MLKLKKVAVTGGLSCGKSTVLSLFKKLGAYVISADEIVHQLLSPETPLGQDVIQLIGIDIVVNNQIDRLHIAKKVFQKPELLHKLERILHPAVYNAIEGHYQQLKEEGKKGLFVAEIPLLFESGKGDFDATIAVTAPQSLCIERFKNSFGQSEEEFYKRQSRQMNPEEKARRATYIITNDGSLEDLQRAVTRLYQQLT